jgi:hypothetical protein
MQPSLSPVHYLNYGRTLSSAYDCSGDIFSKRRLVCCREVHSAPTELRSHQILLALWLDCRWFMAGWRFKNSWQDDHRRAVSIWRGSRRAAKKDRCDRSAVAVPIRFSFSAAVGHQPTICTWLNRKLPHSCRCHIAEAQAFSQRGVASLHRRPHRVRQATQWIVLFSDATDLCEKASALNECTHKKSAEVS